MNNDEYSKIAAQVISTRLGFEVFGCNAKCPLWDHCAALTPDQEVPCELTDEEVEMVKSGSFAALLKPVDFDTTYQLQLYSDAPAVVPKQVAKSKPKKTAKPAPLTGVQLALFEATSAAVDAITIGMAA